MRYSVTKIYLFKAPILLEKILTAIANKITPKNLRTARRPPGPSMRSIKLSDFKTMKTIIKLTKMPPSIYASSKLAFSDIIVVSVPLPAIIGNAMGTTAPDCAFLSP